jgi:hypothetical protein
MRTYEERDRALRALREIASRIDKDAGFLGDRCQDFSDLLQFGLALTIIGAQFTTLGTTIRQAVKARQM